MKSWVKAWMALWTLCLAWVGCSPVVPRQVLPDRQSSVCRALYARVLEEHRARHEAGVSVLQTPAKEAPGWYRSAVNAARCGAAHDVERQRLEGIVACSAARAEYGLAGECLPEAP